MTYTFRTHYVGLPLADTRELVASSWHGSEVEAVNATTFLLRNPSVLPLFAFYFVSDPAFGLDSDPVDSVKLIVTRVDPPFERVMLITDRGTTNYVIRSRRRDLNRHERKLCKALEKTGKIPRGKTGMPDGQVPEGFMDFSRMPSDAEWNRVSKGLL